jgi:hypothetical protein
MIRDDVGGRSAQPVPQSWVIALPELLGRNDVGIAHIRVVILRRILGEVPAVKSLKVRP